MRGFNINVDMVPIQRPVSVKDEVLTLEQCLKDIVPGVMEMYYDEQSGEQIDIVVQGMKVPLNVPMLWLTRHAMYADCFLYVVIVKYQKI